MAGPHLIPIPIAVLLITLIMIATPGIPMAWVIMTIIKVAQGVRQTQDPGEVAKSIGRWTGLCVVLPWAAVIVLSAMVVVQLALAPLVLLQQLRDLRETVNWLSASLRIATNAPAVAQDTAAADMTSVPRHIFSPLHPGPATAIRLLSLQPSSNFTSPLRGTISTAILTSHPAYDALSYSRTLQVASINTSTSNPDPNASASTLLYLSDPKSSDTWTALPLASSCAAALRRLRQQAGTKPRRVWVDEVCINQEDAEEKACLVGVRDRIFCEARRVLVVVDTAGTPGVSSSGEGEENRELEKGMEQVFKWANGLRKEELSIPRGIQKGNLLGEGPKHERVEGLLKGWVMRTMPESMLQSVDALERALGVWRGKGKQAREVLQERYRVCVLRLPPAVPTAPPENLRELLQAFFSRQWFKRVWSFQEVALPELSRVRFLCGRETASGERILHLSTLLGDGSSLMGSGVGQMFRLIQHPSPQRVLKRPHLLDILIEMRERQCEDPRDKIFGALKLARRLDHAAWMLSTEYAKVDYRKSVAEVYASYSAQFIRWHGPGFFLALIKSAPQISGLPSWAADWTVPWPNQYAVADADFAARSRTANDRDEILDFETGAAGCPLIMSITKPKIVRGFFTRDGHLDGAERVSIESVRQLRRDEVLVEMCPGLALLLRREKSGSERCAFVRACPHALSREGVERVVAGWSRVVVSQERIGHLERDGSPPKAYLSLPKVYKIV